MSGITVDTSDVSWVAESGDCINRQDAINVAIQAADDWDGGYNPERAEMIERGLKMLPALQPMMEIDCVSRQAVLDMATTIQTDDFSGNEIIEVVDVDDIKALPSVTPTRPTGHWIKYQEPWGGMQGWKCSNCKNHYDVSSVYTMIPYNYCPNCGRRCV